MRRNIIVTLFIAVISIAAISFGFVIQNISVSTLPGTGLPSLATSTTNSGTQSPTSEGINTQTIATTESALVSSGGFVTLTQVILNLNYVQASIESAAGPVQQEVSNFPPSIEGGTQFKVSFVMSNNPTLSEDETSISLSNFVVTTPGFTIVSVSPNPPVTLVPLIQSSEGLGNVSAAITLTIQAPNYTYDGSLVLGVTVS